jgi:ATP-binding cassette, subfamily C, bacterial LapB
MAVSTNPSRRHDQQDGPADNATSRPRRGHSLFRLLFDTLRLPPSVIIGSVFINLLGLALPLVILQIFDRVLRNESINTLVLLLAGLIGAITIEAALRLGRNSLLTRIALRESFDQQMGPILRFFGAPRRAVVEQSATSLFDGFSASDDISNFLSSNGRLALLDAPFVLLFLGVIWLIGGALAFLPAVLIVVFIAWTAWSSRRFKRALETQLRDETQRFSFYAECLSGIGTIKSLAIEPQMERRMERIMRSGTSTNYDLVLRGNRMITNGQLFASATMISIVTVGGYMAIHGLLSLGAVAACTLIGNRVTQPVMRIVGVWGQMEAVRLAHDRAQTLYALAQMPDAAAHSGPAAITFERVAMREPADAAAANGISLSVAAGSITGFACRRYAEQAQLQEILRGRETPDLGQIMIDGVDLASDEGGPLCEQTFFVGGEPVILRGTILENISMFRSGVAQIQAVSTARRLGVEPIINALPNGYETRMGDANATVLDRDLLHALDIVRAVAARPRLLIMERVGGAANDIGAHAIRQAIEALRGDCTIIMAGAHPEDMREAETIYALKGWRVSSVTHPGAPPAQDGDQNRDASPRWLVANEGGK